jgi:hypothetical protein
MAFSMMGNGSASSQFASASLLAQTPRAWIWALAHDGSHGRSGTGCVACAILLKAARLGRINNATSSSHSFMVVSPTRYFIECMF